MLLEIKEIDRRNPTGRGKKPRVMVFKCDECSCTFERRYSRYSLNVPHYCTQECSRKHLSGIGARGGEIVISPCVQCGVEVKRLNCTSVHNKNTFCSRDCVNRWQSDHPEAFEAQLIAMHTPEVAKKISDKAIERMSQPGYVHSQTGLKRSEKTRALLRQRKLENPPAGEKNGMWGREQSVEAREKMSDAVSQRIIDGRYHPYGTRNVKGYYTSNRDNKIRFYRSSWELAMMKYLDESTVVNTWDSECVRIPYRYDGQRWYVPDFIVTFSDGHREMWEIKPREFINSEKVLLKADAARKYCEQNDIREYKILTGDSLREMNVL